MTSHALSNRKFINVLVDSNRHLTAYAEPFKATSTPEAVWLLFLKLGIRGDVWWQL